MFRIIFPANNRQHYFHLHYQYVLNILQYLKCDISFSDGMDIDTTCFLIEINGKTFAIDFSDGKEVNKIYESYPTFKFHATKQTIDKVMPFPSISFYDWEQFYQLEKSIKYNPENDIIACRQRIYGNAIERRTKVQNMLKNLLTPKYVRLGEIYQLDYWKEINELGLSVMVPGQNNNILDRGHAQQMAFGMCTVSPELPEQLPFGMNLDGCYWKCSDDYIDLAHMIIDKPNKANEFFQEIGDKAKKTFMTTSTPEAIADWIELCLV